MNGNPKGKDLENPNEEVRMKTKREGLVGRVSTHVPVEARRQVVR